MSGKYRGSLRIVGPYLKGWIIREGEEALRLNLIVDDTFRGSLEVGRSRRSEDAASNFSILIDPSWVNGRLQTIRLEDPGDLDFDFSFKSRLGPAKRQLFPERVVASRVVIGAEARAPSGDGHDDEAEQDASHRFEDTEASGTIMQHVASMSDGELTAFIDTVFHDVLIPRIKQHQSLSDWASIGQMRRRLTGPNLERVLLAVGRSAIYGGRAKTARRLLLAAVALKPESAEANFYAGVALNRAAQFKEALQYLRAASHLEPDNVRSKREMVAVIGRYLRSELQPGQRGDLQSEQIGLLRDLIASPETANNTNYAAELANALCRAGQFEEALAIADRVLEFTPDHLQALTAKARVLVSMNAISAAMDVYKRLLHDYPGHRGALTNLRLLQALSEDGSPGQEKTTVGIFHPDASPPPTGDPDQAEPEIVEHLVLASQLASSPNTWICTGPATPRQLAAPELAFTLDASRLRRNGYARLRTSDGDELDLWRRDALAGLAESGLIGGVEDQQGLKRWAPYYTGVQTNGAGLLAKDTRRGAVILTSRHGATKFGGGEHFLESAAEHYATVGYEPVIVGTRPEFLGQEGETNGIAYAFIEDSAAAFRRFALERGAALVHAISGMGFLVSEALNLTNIPFVYGVHFWRELLGDADEVRYFDEQTGAPIPRREFQVILSRAATVYANSDYTQKIIETGFGVRCPVVYSVPRETELARE